MAECGCVICTQNRLVRALEANTERWLESDHEQESGFAFLIDEVDAVLSARRWRPWRSRLQTALRIARESSKLSSEIHRWQRGRRQVDVP